MSVSEKYFVCVFFYPLNRLSNARMLEILRKLHVVNLLCHERKVQMRYLLLLKTGISFSVGLQTGRAYNRRQGNTICERPDKGGIMSRI